MRVKAGVDIGWPVKVSQDGLKRFLRAMGVKGLKGNKICRGGRVLVRDRIRSLFRIGFRPPPKPLEIIDKLSLLAITRVCAISAVSH